MNTIMFLPNEDAYYDYGPGQFCSSINDIFYNGEYVGIECRDKWLNRYWYELFASLPVIEECSKKFAFCFNDCRYDVYPSDYPNQTEEWIKTVKLPEIIEFIIAKELEYENQTVS